MKRTTSLLLGIGGVVGVAALWNQYQRYTTETVPYTVVARVGDVDLRRYPPTVLAETVADSRREAFGRLFRYISGANDADADLSMTAPVKIGDGDEGANGVSIPMTAPVEVSGGDRRIPMTAAGSDGDDADGVRMAFYLPTEYDAESAPRPTDADVTIVAVPERTLAVRRFSWRPTERRLEREVNRLEATLSAASVPLAGEPFYMGYDAPGTLPFLRRNEVAVEVESAAAT